MTTLRACKQPDHTPTSWHSHLRLDVQGHSYAQHVAQSYGCFALHCNSQSWLSRHTPSIATCHWLQRRRNYISTGQQVPIACSVLSSYSLYLPMLKYLFKPSSKRAIARSTSHIAPYTLLPCRALPTAFPHIYPTTLTWKSTLMKSIMTILEATSILFNYPTVAITTSTANKVAVIRNVKAMMSDYLTLRYRDMTIWTSANTIAGMYGHLSHYRETPAFFLHNVDMQQEFNYVQLGRDARRMLATPNAGGTSILSEVMSMELMQRLLGAKMSKTEMELVYSTSNTPITDYSCIIPAMNGQPAKRIAVSVTRAMAYQRKFRPEDAKRLLTKKLRGVFYSNQTLANEPIERQILHIWTPSGAAANIVRKLWYKMPRELLCNTVVLVSIVNSHWIFDNRIQ